MKRVLAFAALTLVAATASPADAGSHSLQVTSIGRLQFPDRGYVVDLPRHVRLGVGQVSVRENGKPVEDLRLMPVTEAATKVGVVLAIDASDSMAGPPYRGAIAGARTFASRRSSRELVGVVAFNSRAHVLLRPTSDGRALDAVLATPARLANGTRIYDAIATSIDLLERAHVSAGVVVLLSDGRDTGSSIDERRATALAKAKHVRIFTVGLHSPEYSATPLRNLARDTGGGFAQAKSTRDLNVIYGGLGAKLASEYLVAYRSTARARSKVDVAIGIAGFEPETFTYRAGPERGLGAWHRPVIQRFWSSAASMVFIGLAAMALIGGALALILRRRPTMLVSRLSQYLSIAPVEEEPRRPILTNRLVATTESSLSGTKWWARFEEELEIAGIKVPPGQIVLGTAIATLLGAVILALLWLPLFLAAAAVPFAVRTFLKQKLERVRNAYFEQLPDNLQVLASALRAGHSFTGALAVVAKDAPEPARREFQRVIADEQLGVPVDVSLREVARRMQNDDTEQVGLLAELQREAGGNMAEVLDTVVETIRERFDLRRLVKTLTAQGRMARWVLTLLPVFLACAISVLNPGYMDPMLGTTLGRIALLLATVMVISGSLVIKRIVDIEV